MDRRRGSGLIYGRQPRSSRAGCCARSPVSFTFGDTHRGDRAAKKLEAVGFSIVYLFLLVAVL